MPLYPSLCFATMAEFPDIFTVRCGCGSNITGTQEELATVDNMCYNCYMGNITRCEQCGVSLLVGDTCDVCGGYLDEEEISKATLPRFKGGSHC